ncbi:cytochrome P450 736A117 [Rosa chinensis]|nr:cytochrome P450 736A117 [Rosa chinensis]
MLEHLSETFSSLHSFPITLVLVLPIFFTLFLHRWSLFSVTTKNSPPSPPKLLVLRQLLKIGSNPHRSLQNLAQRYGSDFMVLYLGTAPLVLVSSAEAAREIMKTNDLEFSNRPKSVIFQKLLCNYKDVAMAPYGEYWKQVKSICVVNLLSNKRVRSFRAVREEETKLMINKINESSGEVMNLREMFVMLTSDVICRVTMGRKYSASAVGEGGNTILFKELLWEFTELLRSFYIGDYIPWLAWLSRVNGLEAKLDKVAKQFDDFLDRVIQDRVDHRSKASGSSGHVNHADPNGEDEKDLVDVLLEIQEGNLSGLPIDRVSIKAVILDMLGGGADSTYSVIEWTMAELLRHPRVMKKLQSEVRELAGDKTHITEDDLIEMNYLNAVIKETLRLHPPFTVLSRMSGQDVEVKGYKIKANTRIVVNMWQIGRDPKSYNKPEEYEPERFLNENSGVSYKGNDFRLIPFGAGRRVCPGIQFAMAVNKTALANLVHKFDWALPGGASGDDLDMTESTGMPTHRKHPLKAVAIPYLANYG